jgi:nucleoside phosphorylase
MSDRKPIILCPLEFERKVLQRQLSGTGLHVACCGPGKEGVTRWAGMNRKPGAPVVLAGLAGSLVEELNPGDVVDLEAAVAPGNIRIETNWRLPASCGAPRVTGTISTRLVNSRPARRALHRHLGCSIVDMESLAFARVARDLGWTFGMLRGISDGLDETLPPGCDQWVDHRGRVAKGAIAVSILRTPSLIGRMRLMKRTGEKVLETLAKHVITSLETGLGS